MYFFIYFNKIKAVFVHSCLLFCSAFLLAGCNTQNSTYLVDRIATPNIKTPNQCDGWEKLELKGRSRYYLMEQDQRLLINIEAHNLRGQQLGCWK